jgi:serine/threonine-protein kinase
MEFVDGESLAKLVDRDGPLDEDRALHLALQIARALEHAHKHGLVHRDVKPQNVLVSVRRSTEDGETEDLAKLCDLGLAKSLDDRRSSADREREGLPLGTPHYLSPEQARGEADVDIRSDIYSLGATLYHALTGRPPFDGQSPMVLMTKHLTEDPVPPKKRNPEVSKAASDLVLKMMSKAKEDRHQTPAELIEEIERALEGKPSRTSRRGGATSGRGTGTARRKRPASRDDEEPRRSAARTRTIGPASQSSSGAAVIVVLALILGSLGLYLVSRGVGVGPTAQDERDADDLLGYAKVDKANATTDEEMSKVRKKLDHIVEAYPGTQAANEARRLRDTIR